MTIGIFKNYSKKKTQKPVRIEKPVEKVDTSIVCATCYNADSSQCDADFLTTASGKKITLINRTIKHRFVAVSRDLKKGLKWGDTIFVYSENKLIAGAWFVQDLMNKRFVNRIDFLVDSIHNNKIGKINNLKITYAKI